MATQKPPTREQRRARRVAAQRAKSPIEHRELERMLDAIKKDAASFFAMGEFRCRRRLSNGAVVRVVITMPAEEAQGST